jgi:hypothetical protein
MKILYGLLFLLSTAFGARTKTCYDDSNIIKSNTPNSCVTFFVSQGTGCAWMCSYCASQLGTNNYYFTDNVCTYQQRGCAGNPIAGKSYTCCSN